MKRVAQMLDSRTIAWIPIYLQHRSTFYISMKRDLGRHELQYLGKHAGRKRKRDISNATQARYEPSRSRNTSTLVYPQGIHPIGPAVASPPLTPRRQLSNTSYEQDDANILDQRDQPISHFGRIHLLRYQMFVPPNETSLSNNNAESYLLP